jgi:hypothetical protein
MLTFEALTGVAGSYPAYGLQVQDVLPALSMAPGNAESE